MHYIVRIDTKSADLNGCSHILGTLQAQHID